MSKQFIKEVKTYAKLYKDTNTGIAWIEDGSTGCSHSCHANIDSSGSVTGMKILDIGTKKIEQSEVMDLFIILIHLL